MRMLTTTHKSEMRINFGYPLLVAAVLVILLSSGCAGPRAIRQSRAKYAETIQDTRNEQLLLNMVRLRYRDTPSFLELSSLATQFNFDESVGVGTTLKENSSNFDVLGLNASWGMSERPTVSYTPLQGADFVTQLIAPVEEETIVLLTRSGWKGERVFRVAVQSLNGLPNLRKASGPTPTQLSQREINNAIEFQFLVQSLESLSEEGAIRFNYETVETPKSVAIPKTSLTPQDTIEATQQGLKIIHPHTQVAINIDKIKSVSPEVNDYLDEALLDNVVAKIDQEGLPHPIRVTYDPHFDPANPELSESPFRVLDDDLLFKAVEELNRENGDFTTVQCDIINPDEVILAGSTQKLVMTWDAEHNLRIDELGLPSLKSAEEGRYVLRLEPRSLLGAMFYLSHSVQVPIEHQMAGLTVMTNDEFGSSFDWNVVTSGLLDVRYSERKPECAAIAVEYRGYWFYIDDRDHDSKATFALLSQLFELRAGGGAGKGPVLTLPVGI